MSKRASGILLHITSLASDYGIGDFGSGAYQFVDFLAQAGQKYWQILPLTQTNPFLGNSPYSSCSAFAGNILFISPDVLVKEGFLAQSDLDKRPVLSHKKVDYALVARYKNKLFDKVYANKKKGIAKDRGFNRFCDKNSAWLNDYSLFMGLKQHFSGESWVKWPAGIRNRKAPALNKWWARLSERIEREKFLQYLFFKQWSSLKIYCRQKNIKIIGDLPIYVNHDSVDVWMNPSIFKLDTHGQPQYVAGVPPDYFSETGQRWGNPVYNWKRLERTNFRWWIERIKHNLDYFDVVRIDHFRGLVAYWEIPVLELTAVNGQWVDVPSDKFFKALCQCVSRDLIVAEDLGTITPDVTATMEKYGFPGMKILIFAFGGDIKEHPYIPENYTNHCIGYTGTHDNNTIRGWFRKEATDQEKKNLFQYLGKCTALKHLSWALIERIMMSEANTVIFPLQDVLGLGEGARMNRPGTCSGNWQWRLLPELLTPDVTERLVEMTKLHNR